MVIISSPSPVSTIVYPLADLTSSSSSDFIRSDSPEFQAHYISSNSSSLAISTPVKVTDVTTKELFAQVQTIREKKLSDSEVELMKKEFLAENAKKMHELTALQVAEIISICAIAKMKEDTFISTLQAELIANSAQKLWKSTVAELIKVAQFLTDTTVDKDLKTGLQTILVSKAKLEK